MSYPFRSATKSKKPSAPVEWHEAPYRDSARSAAAWSRHVPKLREHSTDGCSIYIVARCYDANGEPDHLA